MVFPGMMPKNARACAAASNACTATPDASPKKQRLREMVYKGPDNLPGPLYVCKLRRQLRGDQCPHRFGSPSSLLVRKE